MLVPTIFAHFLVQNSLSLSTMKIFKSVITEGLIVLLIFFQMIWNFNCCFVTPFSFMSRWKFFTCNYFLLKKFFRACTMLKWHSVPKNDISKRDTIKNVITKLIRSGTAFFTFLSRRWRFDNFFSAMMWQMVESPKYFTHKSKTVCFTVLSYFIEWLKIYFKQT